MSSLQERAESLSDGAVALGGALGLNTLAREVARTVRDECLTVRLPGIPYGEYVANLANWWADSALNLLQPGFVAPRSPHEEVLDDIGDFLGVDFGPLVGERRRPRLGAGVLPRRRDFLVQATEWRDLIVLDGQTLLQRENRRLAAQDRFEAIMRSPTPPAIREAGELLTSIDNLQDEAATLAIGLGLVERVVGRAIPGVGAIASVADALNVVGVVTQLATASTFPGTRSKRTIHGLASARSNGIRGRIEAARRTGRLRVGLGDALQGLQATSSLFGYGISLGPIVGFLQDSFWGAVRGAEFRARGPLWDPLGFSAAGRRACTNSPTLEQVHARAYYALANTALDLWSSAGRLGPWIDVLGEQALAWQLVGMRLAEQVLGPWLRQGNWVTMVEEVLREDPTVAGGVAGVDQRRIPASAYLEAVRGGTVASTTRAVLAVPDRDRQAFYESLVSSIGWGLLGSLDPGAIVVERKIAGPLRDAFLSMETHRVPPPLDLE